MRVPFCQESRHFPGTVPPVFTCTLNSHQSDPGHMAIPGLQGVLENREKECAYWLASVQFSEAWLIAAPSKIWFLLAKKKGEWILCMLGGVGHSYVFLIFLSYTTPPTGRYHITTRIQKELVTSFPNSFMSMLLPLSLRGKKQLNTLNKYKVQRGLALPTSCSLVLSVFLHVSVYQPPVLLNTLTPSTLLSHHRALAPAVHSAENCLLPPHPVPKRSMTCPGKLPLTFSESSQPDK